MAIYHFENNLLSEFQKTNFTSEGIKERQHLQSALKEQVEIIASDCLVIAEEFSEWSESQRRIDLLAIDKQANIVVIELKRTDTGEFMELQAIRYASMVSTLTFQKATEIYQKYLNLKDSSEDAETLLLDFLGWDEAKAENFASDVRIILVSANFSKELTTSVMWLNERDLDIRCVRLIPYKFEDKIFVDVQQIIPLPEAESYQIKIKQQSEERREARKSSSKDYTRYLFNNQEFNKRKLVLAVIKKWIAENSPQNFEELIRTFPQSLHRGNLFVTKIEAEEISQRQNGKRRYFLEEDEVIYFPDSSYYAVSNQWNKDSVSAFIEHSRNLGFEFEAVPE